MGCWRLEMRSKSDRGSSQRMPRDNQSGRQFSQELSVFWQVKHLFTVSKFAWFDYFFYISKGFGITWKFAWSLFEARNQIFPVEKISGCQIRCHWNEDRQSPKDRWRRNIDDQCWVYFNWRQSDCHKKCIVFWYVYELIKF